MRKPRTEVKSADRTVELLELLADHPAGVTHAQISHLLSIPKSSLTVLLQNLVRRHYVSQDHMSRTYGLGPALGELLRRHDRAGLIRDAATSILKELVLATGETAAFCERSGNRMAVSLVEQSPSRIPYQIQAGENLPLHASAVGKIALAHEPTDTRQAMLDGLELSSLTPSTHTSKPELLAELSEISRTGVAVARDELIVGATSIASAVLSRSGVFVGAFSLGMPTSRYNEAAQVIAESALRAAANRLSAEIP